MKFEHTQVMNFEGAFRGLRNPLESWGKSDSYFGIAQLEYCDYDYEVATEYIDANEKYDFNEQYDKWDEANEKYAEWLRENGVLKCDYDHNAVKYAYLGPKDLDLAHRMIKAGTSDRKFLRQIFVSVDITAPLYWWKEADTYKVGTVANSTSTMHKLASTPITMDCFETDDLVQDLKVFDQEPYNYDTNIRDCWEDIICFCETLRQKYNQTKDKRYWKELIRILPEGWLQTRTVTLNYEVLRNIYFQRRYHKLTEWHQLCEWIESLPYAKELITYEG